MSAKKDIFELKDYASFMKLLNHSFQQQFGSVKRVGLAEEQQQKQHFKDRHHRRAGRGLNLACYNSQYDKALRGSQYGLIPFIEFERRESSSSEREASREFQENKRYDNKIVDVMLLCEFGSSLLPQVSLLDSFETNQGWCAGKNKDKMLDLIIATEKQSTTSDKDSQIIFKIWIHNSLSCKKSSFHTQIIEQIHYSRCSFFIFLFEENNMHDILECYERVKQIKGNMVKGAFIAINTDIAFETNNRIPESMIAFKSLKSYHHDNLSHLVSFREINSKDVSEQLRLLLKDAYAAQEGKDSMTSNQGYLLENEKTPGSASTNKTRSSSSNSGNSSNSSNVSEGIEASTNIKDIFQQTAQADMQINGQQDAQILGSPQQNINQKSNEEQQHQQQQNNENNKINNKLHPCKFKGSKSEDFVKLSEPFFGGLKQQGLLNTSGKQQTRSFSYHCSSLCLTNNKKKDINHDFKTKIGECFSMPKQNLFSQSHQIPREVTFNSSQH